MSFFFNNNTRWFWIPLFVFVAFGAAALLIIDKGDFVLAVNKNATLFWDSVFKIVTDFGLGGVFVIPIVIGLFVRFHYAISGTISLILTGVFTYLFKQVLFNGMPRPTGYFDSSVFHHLMEGFDYHAANSFPSGHTMSGIALALFLALWIQKPVFNMVIAGFGLLIAFSRMYLLQHFFIDIYVGTLFGVVCTLLGYYFGMILLVKKYPGLNGSLLTVFNKK